VYRGRAEVLDESLTRMPAPEPVIKVREQFYRRAEPLNVGHADANPAGSLAICRAASIDEPPQRGIIPGERI
jgi:hypothetical protein